MSLFKWAEEESSGSPLFAAALAGGAAGSMPAAAYLRDRLLVPQYHNLSSGILAQQGSLASDVVAALKSNMLDKDVARHLHVLKTKKPGGSLVTVGKNFLPSRIEFEKSLFGGGIPTFEGTLDPFKAVKDMRKVRGFVELGGSHANPVTLAHELGHATSRNSGTFLRGPGLPNAMYQVGNSLARSGTKGALAAAILAGSFDSEDKRKWAVPGILAASQIPLLAEEGIASIRAMEGLRALKDITGNPALEVVGDAASSKLLAPAVMENAGKLLRRAWGTYGLTSSGLLAAPLLAIGARSQWDKSID